MHLTNFHTQNVNVPIVVFHNFFSLLSFIPVFEKILKQFGLSPVFHSKFLSDIHLIYRFRALFHIFWFCYNIYELTANVFRNNILSLIYWGVLRVHHMHNILQMNYQSLKFVLITEWKQTNWKPLSKKFFEYSRERTIFFVWKRKMQFLSSGA